MLKKVKQFCFAALMVYIALVTYLYVSQRNMIYHPTQIEGYTASALNNINAIMFNKDDLEWLYLPSYEAGSTKVLIYFHGNAGTAYDRAPKAEIWRENGFEVILAEYPGYGSNDGKPSESNFYGSARIIIKDTLDKFPDADLYLYGESIGSGVATQMATEYDEKALIIEAGFSSLTAAAQNRYPFVPVSFLLKDKYENISKINDIGSPLYMIHGKEDSIIPYRIALDLYNHYEDEKRIFTVQQAGHNNIYSRTDMQKIINQINP